MKRILKFLIFLFLVFLGVTNKSDAEILGRGLICLPKAGSAYCSWRIFPTDGSGIGFNIYRDISPTGQFSLKINNSPITNAASFHDTSAQSGKTYYYSVSPVKNGIVGEKSAMSKVTAGATKDYIDISVPGKSALRVVPGDVNGDGEMDFIVLAPYGRSDSADCVNGETMKLLGFIRENGEWKQKWQYDKQFKNCDTTDTTHLIMDSVLVWDLNGDQKAEVVTRAGSKTENLVVLNGENGNLISSVVWPTYGNLEAEKRNMAVISNKKDSDGDGIDDFHIVIQTGLYGTKQLFSEYFFDKKTNKLVLKNSVKFPYGAYFGSRGTHGFPVADINNDGKDEIIPCGTILNNDLSMLKEVINVHCDGCFSGDVRPDMPGLETFMGQETIGKRGNAYLVDSKGNIIWQKQAYDAACGFEGGWCAEISTSHEGAECFAYEMNDSGNAPDDYPKRARVFASDGSDITGEFFSDPYLTESRRSTPLDWKNGEGVKEVYFNGNPTGTESGSLYFSFWGDIFGDSREEIIGGEKYASQNKFRIYTNIEDNNKRYVTPLSDRNYRAAIARVGVGYRTNYIPLAAGQERDDAIYLSGWENNLPAVSAPTGLFVR